MIPDKERESAVKNMPNVSNIAENTSATFQTPGTKPRLARHNSLGVGGGNHSLALFETSMTKPRATSDNSGNKVSARDISKHQGQPMTTRDNSGDKDSSSPISKRQSQQPSQGQRWRATQCDKNSREQFSNPHKQL